jgi:hypothetical protein
MTSEEKPTPTIIKIQKNDIGFINYKPEKIPDYDKIMSVAGKSAFKSSELSKNRKKYNDLMNILQKFIEKVKDIINNDTDFVNNVFEYNPNNKKHQKIFDKLKNVHKNQVKCEDKKVITSGFFSSTFETDEIKNITDVINHITKAIDNCFRVLNDIAQDYAKSASYTGQSILKTSGLDEAQLKPQYSTSTSADPQGSSAAGVYYGGSKSNKRRHKHSSKKLNLRTSKKIKK